MNNQTDAIEELAYCELVISCQEAGCMEILGQSLEKQAGDPVEVWAAQMAGIARESGWKTDNTGKVLRPRHAPL